MWRNRLKAGRPGADGNCMGRRRWDRAAERPDEVISPEVADLIHGGPKVRAEAIARARALLESGQWCSPQELAAALVDSMVEKDDP